jgi:hypothetical protein
MYAQAKSTDILARAYRQGNPLMSQGVARVAARAQTVNGKFLRIADLIHIKASQAAPPQLCVQQIRAQRDTAFACRRCSLDKKHLASSQTTRRRDGVHA